jgi:hypothetical protein
MKTFLTILVALAMAGVLAVLAAGMIGMIRGQDDPGRSNRLMRWRVLLQAAALALFAILLFLIRG